MRHDLQTKVQKIRAFIFDVDGVLTDGGIILDNHGIETKRFNIKDGWAIVEIKKYGFKTAVITGRKSELVAKRMQDLKIDYLVQGALDKREAYTQFKQQFDLNDDEIAYIGDDLIDLPLLMQCGLSACPGDAVSDVASRVDIVMHKMGGYGAVREFIEFVLRGQNRWDDVLQPYINGEKV